MSPQHAAAESAMRTRPMKTTFVAVTAAAVRCRGEPGGMPRGCRLCVGVSHAEPAGDLGMAEDRREGRVSRRAGNSVHRKGKWYGESAAFVDVGTRFFCISASLSGKGHSLVVR